MREELAKRKGLRGRWKGTVQCFRERTSGGHLVRMILLVGIRDEADALVADHVHFTLGKCWQGFSPGDELEFEARVTPYWKGYHGERRLDYRLSNPTGIRCLSRPSAPQDRAGQLFLWELSPVGDTPVP